MNDATLPRESQILVVDDDADQLDLVSRLLRHAGFSVQAARDALTGFDLAKALIPDLVISDVAMPNIDGIEFCNMIRADTQLSNTPVLLVSAIRKETETIVQGLYKGADDYLEIPYDPAILVAKVIRLVEVNRIADKLHEEKERLRLAIAAARMGLWEWNIINGEVYWSGERIHGLAPDSFSGTLESYLDQILPEDRELVRSSLMKSAAEGSDHDIEYRTLSPDNRVHWVQGRGALIRNRMGKPVKMIGLCMDITARKQSEKRLQTSHDELERRIEQRTAESKSLEEQLLQSQKLEAVGRLAGGIAHDFNNLLTVIFGYAELSRDRLQADDPLRRNLDEILRAGNRAAALTRQLLAFSRKQVMQPKVIDLNALIADLERMLARMIGEDIELRTTLQKGLGCVRADPGQMEQVIMNLVVNARDALPAGGKVTIETANIYLDKAYAADHVAVPPGRYVMLAVSDNGIGMNEETQQHIFEPFFTTKEVGKGTGLGLSTVYGIVKQSEGNIWVYSEPGKGTTVKTYLPRVDESADEYQRPAALADLPRGNETIILVEDDETVRKLAREVLETCGYRVLEAADATIALLICDQHPEAIHLLLADVVMPEMSGRDVANQLLSQRPQLRVLFMSGYTDDAIVHHGVLDEGMNFIQKPFTPDALAVKVRQALDVSA
jgi:two-component system cell cycle sensor histidine kinase/response regulator CckA